jgi:uncharacterized LabA/DUF88 family protein
MNSSSAQPSPDRVICYVDGFNLYFGLRDKGLRRYYWLNVRRLAESILRPNQVLVETKYFTARISGAKGGDPRNRAARLNAKRKRQSDFLEALETLTDFTIYEGHYLAKSVTCRNCGASWRSHEEKMTDVNIATEMLMDAFHNRFDTALIVSGDSDLVPPIQAVLQDFPGKRVVVAFPQGRISEQLKQAASAWLTIGRKKYRDSQFPDQLTKRDGSILHRPTRWQ